MFRHILLVLGCAVLGVCAPALADNSSIVVVGHRATVEFAPENTIAAIHAAIEKGAQLIEMDVRTSSDGHLVLVHDVTVDRTTNGTGNVSELSLEALQQLDAGSWFDDAFTGERIPTLAEALASLKGRAMPDLDIKEAAPDAVVAALREADIIEGVTVYSGDWRILAAVRDALPGVLIRPTVPPDPGGLDRLIERLDPPIVNIDWKAYSPELIERIHEVGKKAFLNTMQAEDERAAVDESIVVGADYIQSDVLEYLVNAVARQAEKSGKENLE